MKAQCRIPISSFALLLLLCGISATPPMSQTVPSTYGLFVDAQEAYYDASPEVASGFLDKYLAEEGLSATERIEGLALQACIRAALRQSVLARESVEAILAIQPKYRFDPDATPPSLMRTFFQVLTERGELGYDDRENTVAVPRFLVHSTNPDLVPLGESLSDALIADLTRAEGVVVVERERLNFLIAELSIPDSLRWREPQQLQVGKMLGARYVLFGSMTPVGESTNVVLRLVETESSKVVPGSGVNVRGDLEDLFDLLLQAGREVLDDLGGLDPGPTEDEAELRAMQEYSLGLERMYSERPEEARKHFETALDVSPGYSRAKTRLRQIAPLLVGNSPGEDR